MNKALEERKIEFAKKLSVEGECNYEDMFATVSLLCMDGKFEEAIKKYNLDKTDFYLWASKALLLIHLKLGF